jgi:hypothetical protein
VNRRRERVATRRRDLIVANLAALLLLVVVLLLGWWQEAAFGLAVLFFLDLFVFLRGRQTRSAGVTESEKGHPEPGETAEPE